MCKIFVKSYEDNDYIGCEIPMAKLVDLIIAGSKFPKMSFNELMEFFKQHSNGNFFFCSHEMIDQLHPGAFVIEPCPIS